MSRNLLAFLLTSSLYIVAGAMLIYAPMSIESIAPPKDNSIKISVLVEPKPEPITEPEPIVEPEPILEPEPTPKPISKPKPIPIPKPKPKKIVKKQVVKKKTVKKTAKKVTKKRVISSKSGSKRVATSSQRALLKKKFLQHVKSNIQKNKKYPRVALRRGLEGDVHVVFDIQKSGAVSNIRIGGAHSILQKATKRAIEKSFPIAIPAKLRSSLPIRNVALTIGFRIR